MALFSERTRTWTARRLARRRHLVEALEDRRLLTATPGLPWTQVAELTDSADFGAGDLAGQEVAISGDTIVISSHADDDAGMDAGAAYVYKRDDGGTPNDPLDDVWLQQAKLIASDAATEDGFGIGVAIEGDTIVVGSPSNGKAYIFKRNGSTWSEVAKLTASDGAVDDRFGTHVAIEGDTIVVTALKDDDLGVDSGSAYVFLEPAGGWSGNLTETAKLTAGNGEAGDRFGRSVAAKDGTVLIGADLRNSGQGSAYVFERDDNATPESPEDDFWTQIAQLISSDGESGDQFGNKVAIDGTRAVVTAMRDDVLGEVDAGSAYVFQRQADGSWVESAKLTASDAGADDEFGRGVDVEGDTIVVGAWSGEIDVVDSGSVYFFQRQSDGSWLEQGEVSSNDAGSANNFGSSRIDLQGNTLVVGDPKHDHNGQDSGSAFVFVKSTTATLFSDSFEAGQWAGNWVEDGQNDWFTSSQRSTDGSYSAEVDGRATNATLTLSNPIDLNGYSSAELTYDWLIESGFDSGEYLSLDMSTDGGGSWTTDVLRLNGNSSPENTWHSETVDLTPYTSSNLLVRFRAYVSRSNEDANVDNVKIIGTNQNAVTTISYPDFSETTELNLIGDAVAPVGANNALRLTPQLARYSGGAWHNESQVVAASFETEFEFQFDANGTDGFAFVIQNDSDWTFGGLGGGLGYDSIPNSLAIEFDTFLNSNFGDPDNNHVAVHTRGVSPNSIDSSAVLATATPSFDINDGQLHHVRVAYEPGMMSVFLDHSLTPHTNGTG